MDINIEKLFGEIEKEFNMDHACSCPKYCRCWADFKHNMRNKLAKQFKGE